MGDVGMASSVSYGRNGINDVHMCTIAVGYGKQNLHHQLVMVEIVH